MTLALAPHYHPNPDATPTPTPTLEQVTLNGQQYSAFGHAFNYFAPPIAALVAPTGGPTQGGTVIIVSGSDFAGSDQRHSDRRCVLGAALMPADLVNGTLR